MSDSKKTTGPNIDTDIFKVLVQKYLPYVPMFITVGLLCLGLSFLYSKVAVKSYEVTAAVLIQDQKKGMDESKMLEALDVFKGKKIVDDDSPSNLFFMIKSNQNCWLTRFIRPQAHFRVFNV